MVTVERVATVCARFNICPSDYRNSHTLFDLNDDYMVAKQLNELDQKKEEARMNSLFGNKK